MGDGGAKIKVPMMETLDGYERGTWEEMKPSPCARDLGSSH